MDTVEFFRLSETKIRRDISSQVTIIDCNDNCLQDFPRLLVSRSLPVTFLLSSFHPRMVATENHKSFNRIYRNAIHEKERKRKEVT